MTTGESIRPDALRNSLDLESIKRSLSRKTSAPRRSEQQVRHFPATSWPLPQARLAVDLSGPVRPKGGLAPFLRQGKRDDSVKNGG